MAIAVRARDSELRERSTLPGRAPSGPRERAQIPMARRGRTPQGPSPQATPSAHRNPISLALRSATGECNRIAFNHLGRREIVSSPRGPGRFANCDFVAIFLRSHGDTTRATQVRAWHAKPRAPRGQPGHRMSPPDQHRVRRPRSAAEPSRASPRMEGLLVGGNVPFLTCPPAWVRPRPVPGWPSPAEASSCVLRTPSDDPMRRSFVTQASKPCARSAAPRLHGSHGLRSTHGASTARALHFGGAASSPLRSVPKRRPTGAAPGTMKALALDHRLGGDEHGSGRALLGNFARPGRRRDDRAAMGMARTESTDKEPCAPGGMGTPPGTPHLGSATSVANGIARGSSA